MKKLLYVGGSKGGCGKSTFALALLHYLCKKISYKDILIIESDQANPDISRIYSNTLENTHDGIEVITIPLDEDENNWATFLDVIDETQKEYVVVNSMATSSLGIDKQGMLLNENIINNKLPLIFIAFWLLSRSKDSVLLLDRFLNVMTSAVVYPVKNLYFGQEADFVFYEDAKELKQRMGNIGGETLIFPNLNDAIAEQFFTKDIDPEKLLSQLHIGKQTLLTRWITGIQVELDKVFNRFEDGDLNNHKIVNTKK